jgi:hypothetical protein
MTFDVPSHSQSEKKSTLKNPVVYSAFVLLMVAAYVAYILFSRYESNREYVAHNAEKQAQLQRQEDRQALEQMGGSELAIRTLYVSPSLIHRGESAQLCYDVDNAKTVTLDPPEGEVWPSHSRCLNLSPKKTTNYTLTAKGASGPAVTQSVELKVQ